MSTEEILVVLENILANLRPPKSLTREVLEHNLTITHAMLEALVTTLREDI